MDNNNKILKEVSLIYPDAIVSTKDNGFLEYSSAMIHPFVDELEFFNKEIDSYGLKYFVIPYNMHTLSDGTAIRINSNPAYIPIVHVQPRKLYYSYDHIESFIHYFAYEDMMSTMGIPRSIIGKCHLYIISLLEELKKDKIDIKNNFIPSSIKKLLIFT